VLPPANLRRQLSHPVHDRRVRHARPLVLARHRVQRRVAAIVGRLQVSTRSQQRLKGRQVGLRGSLQSGKGKQSGEGEDGE
jgi:hypothetical protein